MSKRVSLREPIIAHLSGSYIIGKGTGWFRPRVRAYGSRLFGGASTDADGRRVRLARAMFLARDAGARHVVISGNVTDGGTTSDFEALAEVLLAAPFAPEHVTLVPGHQDVALRPDAWDRALAGPLRPFARSSAAASGALVELGYAALMPLQFAVHHGLLRSTREVSAAAVARIVAHLRDESLWDQPVILVQHHPPFPRLSTRDWLRGLRGSRPLMAAIRRFAHAYVLYGSDNAAEDVVVGGEDARIFGAPAMAEDGAFARVRLYRIRGATLVNLGVWTGGHSSVKSRAFRSANRDMQAWAGPRAYESMPRRADFTPPQWSSLPAPYRGAVATPAS